MARNQTLQSVINIAYQLNFYISEQSNPHRDLFDSLLQSRISFVIDRHAEPSLPVSFPYPVDWALESQRPLRKAVNEFTRLASRLPNDLEGFPASPSSTPTPADQPASHQTAQPPPQTLYYQQPIVGDDTTLQPSPANPIVSQATSHPQHSGIETASDLLARPLPILTQELGTHHPSNSRSFISVRLFHEWTSFKDDVRQIIQNTDLNGLVPCTDVTGDTYVVGSELGLTGRFDKHVCDAVSLACKSAGIPLQFGDRQATLPPTDVIPDVVLLQPGQYRKTILPIELKTFWTVRLDAYQIGAGWSSISPLQCHLGQLIEKMRDNNTVYGVLSTYTHTVFLKRVEDCRFQMTKPIPQTATQPSVRQCIMAAAILASEDTEYHESPDFDPKMLQTHTGLQASTRDSPYRGYSTPNPSAADNQIPPQTFHVTTQTILFGGHESVAIDSVEVVKSVLVANNKAIFEVLWHGQPAVAKCWTPSDFQRYWNERRTYELLLEKRPGGYSFIPSPYAAGVIRCSSLFPYGFILVLAKVKGEPLYRRWADLYAHQKEFVYQQALAAVNALRAVGIVWTDPGPHNVLYHQDDADPSVSVIDFECIELCNGEAVVAKPEMTAIFGPEAVQQRNDRRYPGG
ncbi:hypothetical protein N7491_001738 [Penicillium cf. griseofulvum]|uniref:Protein kinase domain-containing protein n=1 Tax=Penicillium cf. griseofulvum TaxID=2972120 RepID=A0A9W9JG98_9EURO|nr:hypothetical protein N7472_006866 [Penicillium cf. griseofulvum]KAJ5445656.1 hypothetical protein N7491_001738 [Penicillium cf. griseofulvum]